MMSSTRVFLDYIKPHNLKYEITAKFFNNLYTSKFKMHMFYANMGHIRHFESWVLMKRWSEFLNGMEAFSFKNPRNVLLGDVHWGIHRPTVSLPELQPSTKLSSEMMQACLQADKLAYGCKLRCSLRTGERGDGSKQSACTDKV